MATSRPCCYHGGWTVAFRLRQDTLIGTEGLRISALSPTRGLPVNVPQVGTALTGTEELRLVDLGESELEGQRCGGALIGTEGLRPEVVDQAIRVYLPFVGGALIGTEGLRHKHASDNRRLEVPSELP